MNISALKAFAPLVRRQLMEAVTQKLDFVLSAKTPDYLTTFAQQVSALRDLARTDRAGLVERVAYTWFNRLTALRYLDAKDWHPFHARVVMTNEAGESQPGILKMALTETVPRELENHVHGGIRRLNDILDGRIPSRDLQGEAYRLLVLAACNFYHSLLPGLFERLNDETELLLPDDLLTEQSVVAGFRTEIADSDCDRVEVLGWLYQFYISEKKDAVMSRKTVVPAADIPAVTQLFTPHWIVRYLVENSLGRLWMLNRPGSRLREQMPYYLEGGLETDFLHIGRPEEIRLLDPAAGSGHMLTYAFDLLFFIYEEEGYASSDIPGLILANNLFGVEICPRAAQLAQLALVLKGREKSRRFFQADKLVEPNIICMYDIEFTDDELQAYVDQLDLGRLLAPAVTKSLNQFREAATFGSLVMPEHVEDQIAHLLSVVRKAEVGSRLFVHETHKKLVRFILQADALFPRNHIVVTNPPYMGNGGMCGSLKAFAESHYPRSKTDLFSMFIERAGTLTMQKGYSALVTMQSWMFLSSYEELRKVMLEQFSILTLIQIGYNSFPEMNSKIAQACAFVFKGGRQECPGLFLDLNDAQQSADKELVFLDKLSQKDIVTANASNFNRISGTPIAYWASEAALRLYEGPLLRDYASPRQGLATGDNNQFLRYWYEVSMATLGQGMSSVAESKASGRKWFPITKGGSFRRWYGNKDFVVNWEHDGAEIRRFGSDSGRVRSRAQNTQFYFSTGATWSTISSGPISFRLSEKSIFETKGSVCFAGEQCSTAYLLGVLNSKVTQALLRVASPTLDYHEGPLGKIPFKLGVETTEVERRVAELIDISQMDWDNFETSCDFLIQPLLQRVNKRATVAQSWKAWQDNCADAIERTRKLETENNSLFINAYGLQDELTAEVSNDQITLARADARKDIAAFLSYAVGCMMGRYSLERPGLVLANAGDTLDRYLSIIGKALHECSFAPSEDGIIAVLDDEWFEGDIVARTREFLRVTFGDATLRENLRFIEESLGKDLRKYFVNDFYKDHLQSYRKCPIYWLVQSPRKGFSVFFYLHRYTRDTMNIILNTYLRDYQAKLRNRAASVTELLTRESLSSRERIAARKEADKIAKTLHECEEWERQTLLPLAQARVEIALDDGVKANYLKLGDALAPIVGMENRSDE